MLHNEACPRSWVHQTRRDRISTRLLLERRPYPFKRERADIRLVGR